MSDSMQVSKLEAAQRQLDFAICMLFAGADPIAVHTLVGAASIIFTDMVENIAPDKSWDKMAQNANNLAPAEYFNIMRRAQNFFKHARTDHDAALDFDLDDTESLAFWAVMNASELAPLSIEAQVFQLWYIASHSPVSDDNESPLREAIQLFGDLRAKPREERFQAGFRVLHEASKHMSHFVIRQGLL